MENEILNKILERVDQIQSNISKLEIGQKLIKADVSILKADAIEMKCNLTK